MGAGARLTVRGPSVDPGPAANASREVDNKQATPPEYAARSRPVRAIRTLFFRPAHDPGRQAPDQRREMGEIVPDVPDYLRPPLLVSPVAEIRPV